MLFITGTDTDVGKTYVTCRLIKSLQSIGKGDLIVKKPIASGCVIRNNKLVSEDALLISQALGDEDLHDDVVDHLFHPAISPSRAIKLENLYISTQEIFENFPLPLLDKELMIVEGAGGWFSPLTSNGTNQDLAVTGNMDILIVVGNKLGCINHCHLTIQAVQNAGLNIIGIIVNDTEENADIENYRDIKALANSQNIECCHLTYDSQRLMTASDEILELNYFRKL